MLATASSNAAHHRQKRRELTCRDPQCSRWREVPTDSVEPVGGGMRTELPLSGADARLQPRSWFLWSRATACELV